MEQEKKVSKKEIVSEIAYGKTQLMKSKRYQEERDLLMALLDSNKTYTMAEIDAILEAYKKKEVK